MDDYRSVHPPSETDGLTLAAIEAARASAPAKRPVILMGDLNVDLKDIRDGAGETRRIETATLVDRLGLEDLQRHFSSSSKKSRKLDMESVQEW